MTYSNPAVGILHALRAVGGSAITSNNAITGTEKAFLFDSRRELFQFDASETDHYLQVDLGTASPDAFNRLVVFGTHNITGNIGITQDYNAGFTSETTRGVIAVTAGQLVDGALNYGDITEQYVRFYFPITGGQWSMPELWLTERIELTSDGPAWPWDDSYRYNVLDSQKPSGDLASLSLGPRQRVLRYSWPELESADQAVLADLFDGPGRERPFLLWPPYGGDVMMVKLAADPERQIGVIAPTIAETHAVTLDLIELVA